MKITFVASGSEQLAITLLANMAKSQGHEVNVAFSAALFREFRIQFLKDFFDDTELVIEQIKSQNPDILAFSVLTQSYQWMLGIAQRAKEHNPNIKTIFGGVHVSAVPDLVLSNPQVDYVVVGEGEEAFIEILKSVQNNVIGNEINNTLHRGEGGQIIKGKQVGFKQDLDSLPFYTKEIWEGITPIKDNCITMASRGCPYRCTFCFNNFFAELPDDKKTKGKYVRSRSVDHVLDELKSIKNRYGYIKYFDFQDDIFTVNKEWLKEFLLRYKKEIGVPFQCLTHPRYMDDEIAQWLKDAGCVWIQIGIQTMDEEFKNSNLKRYEKSAHIDKALESMLKVGLKVKADHMLALPGEPLEAQESARELYARHCPTRIQTFWTCFLPGTEMLKKAVESGVVSKEQEERLNNGIDFYFFNNPDNIKDVSIIKFYENYQFLFKIYPLLPQSLRNRLKANHVNFIPSRLKAIVNFLADLMNAVVFRNPELLAQINYILFQSKRITLSKIRSSLSRS